MNKCDFQGLGIAYANRFALILDVGLVRIDSEDGFKDHITSL